MGLEERLRGILERVAVRVRTCRRPIQAICVKRQGAPLTVWQDLLAGARVYDTDEQLLALVPLFGGAGWLEVLRWARRASVRQAPGSTQQHACSRPAPGTLGACAARVHEACVERCMRAGCSHLAACRQQGEPAATRHACASARARAHQQRVSRTPCASPSLPGHARPDVSRSDRETLGR